MARMTLSDVHAFIKSWFPQKSTTIVQQVANLIIRDMNLVHTGFTNFRTTFTTAAPITTPTVTISQGSSAAVVAAGTFPVTYDGQFIKLTGSDVWYEISGTVVGTSFNISSGFEGASLVAGACEIAFPRIQLPSELISVEAISRPNRDPLVYFIDEIGPAYLINTVTREPEAFYEVEPENASDDMEVILLHYPDAVYTYVITGQKRITRFDGDATKSGIPEKYEHALLAGCMSLIGDQSRSIEDGMNWRNIYNLFKRESRKHNTPTYQGKLGRVSDNVALIPFGFNPDLVSDNSG